MRVLLIEDETLLAEEVADGLRDRGIAVDLAADGIDGLHKAGANRYDVVVLDRDLPIVHGDQVCTALTAGESDARILMLTAAGEAADRVAGLTLGADDYLPKPFVFDELVLRIRALARRANNAPRVLHRAGITFDTARRVVFRSGRVIPLTTKELAVLEILMNADGGVISSGVLNEHPYDLAVAAAAALSEMDGEAELAGLTITTDLRLAPVNGDPALLDRLVSNLINNAILHNHHGGWIEVITCDGDGVAVLTVRNSGDRIPPEEINRLFEPFQRLAPHRADGAGSNGLGLAIVRSIVSAHRGTVEAAPIAEGGLAVTATLPTRDALPVSTKASEPIFAKSAR